MHIILIVIIANVGSSDGGHLNVNGGSAMINIDNNILILFVVAGQSMLFLFLCLFSSPNYDAKKNLKTNGNSL